LNGPGALSPLFDLTPLKPTQLFDNFYFVGTRSVGAFVIDSGDGLIMIDSGWGDQDCSQFVEDMRKLGLNTGNIKLILISHEHLDHYGGVNYLKREVCPGARAALSVVGWYHLQARPIDNEGGPYSNKPQSIDFFLTDGQRITLGKTVVQIVFTPGHSPGCVSFIIPVTDQGSRHVVGIMGGTGLASPNWERAYVYQSSIDYFQKFSREARCDIGLATHAWDYEEAMAQLRNNQNGDFNPLVIGTEKFDSIYLGKYRKIVQEAIAKLPPEPKMPSPLQVR
jgi:metallo-beta-lactamase class B